MYALGPFLLLSHSIPLPVHPSHWGFEFKLRGVQILLIGFQGTVVFDKTGNRGNIKGNRWKGGTSVSMYVPLVCLKCTVSATNRTYRTNQCDGKSIYSKILLVFQKDVGCCITSDEKYIQYIHSAQWLHHHFLLTLSISFTHKYVFLLRISF